MLFSTPPFVGALFSLVVLRETLTPALLLAAALMVTGVLLMLQEHHIHLHRHELLLHAHRPFWHAHQHHRH